MVACVTGNFIGVKFNRQLGSSPPNNLSVRLASHWAPQ